MQCKASILVVSTQAHILSTTGGSSLATLDYDYISWEASQKAIYLYAASSLSSLHVSGHERVSTPIEPLRIIKPAAQHFRSSSICTTGNVANMIWVPVEGDLVCKPTVKNWCTAHTAKAFHQLI
jgi:hypothetical protein